MAQEAYERTLRARAFDISRYLLPLATNTSLGQIVNARTLETQVSRLLGSPYEEVRRLGERMKQAARGAAWDVNAAKRRALVEAIAAKDAALGEQARAELLRETRVSPTLVKYAEPSAYELASQQGAGAGGSRADARAEHRSGSRGRSARRRAAGNRAGDDAAVRTFAPSLPAVARGGARPESGAARGDHRPRHAPSRPP